jgi:uncharacterized membrane protein YfcA
MSLSASPWLVVVIGALVGVVVGLVGTSGAIMIPVLIYVFGLAQLRAQGTALFIALLPVWGILLLPYARAGHVDWRLGALLAAGLAVGGYFGADWAQHVPTVMLRRVFAVMLALVALRMFLQR